MQVRELIDLLQRVPSDAFVTISGDVIHAIEVVPGKVEFGYMNPTFHPHPNGKAMAVRFLAYTELSTGEVVSFPK